MGQTIVAGLATGGIYGLVAVGIVLIYRGSKVLNFAQGEIGGFSVFIAWVVIERWQKPWLAGAALAVLTAAAIGFAFERVVVRRMGEATRLSVTVATIGLMLLLLGIELRFWGNTVGYLPPPFEGKGPRLFGFHVSPSHLLALAVLAVLGLGLAAFLRRTDFGLGVLAASQDPAATRLVGVPVARVQSFTWTAAAVCSSIAALLIVPTIGVVGVGVMTTLFIRGLAAALLGGLTSLPGAFVGGIGIGLIYEFVGDAFVESQFPGTQIVAIMLVVVAILLVRPQGLLGKARA